jgi:phosphohistidine swiveling domain-containing protein
MTEKADIKRIAKTQWLSRWAGSYTFISCSFWGPQYYRSLKEILKVGFDHTLFFHRQGTVSFFVADDEFREFGSKLAKKSVKDEKYAKKLCDELKKNSDILRPLMKKMKSRIPTVAEYNKFLVYFDRHLSYHNFAKKTVDFFDQENLRRLLPYFEDARKYSEAVYSESESFFRAIAKLIAKKKGYPAELFTCLTQKEFELFLSSQQLPSKNILAARYKNSVLYFEKGKEIIFTGKEAKNVENLIDKQSWKSGAQLKGISAYPGRAAAVARIILDPRKKHIFNPGDILVTGMTRPEFMPYIKKASAIVTDVGGILCHAAIVARELKKPCVIGTKIATKVLHDVDLVEVDADKGIVKIIE